MVHFTRLFFECSARGKVILRQVVHILCLEHQEFAKKPWFNVNTLFHFELRGTLRTLLLSSYDTFKKKFYMLKQIFHLTSTSP